MQIVICDHMTDSISSICFGLDSGSVVRGVFDDTKQIWKKVLSTEDS
jgi:hypothetical protein